MHLCPYGCRGIEGMENPESDALSGEIWDEIERSILPCHHQWHHGEMLIWDNWRVLHQACGCHPKYARVVHRTTIKGDTALAAGKPKKPRKPCRR